MNQLIQQLAIGATEYVDVPMPNEIYNLGEGVFRKILTFNQEKFAELIVRECGNIAFEHWALTHDTSPQESMLRHFGVEE